MKLIGPSIFHWGELRKLIGVLQIKVKHQNEKSPAKFARPKKGATNQTGEKALTGRGKIWLLNITFAR